MPAPSSFVADVRRKRDELTGLLDRLGAAPLPSQANFVTARFEDAGFVRRALAALGIGVRGFGGREEIANCLRFTLPGAGPSFDRLGRALRSALRPEAILLDLDGVVADVSGSYRAAIIETAASFGVTVERG